MISLLVVVNDWTALGVCMGTAEVTTFTDCVATGLGAAFDGGTTDWT